MLDDVLDKIAKLGGKLDHLVINGHVNDGEALVKLSLVCAGSNFADGSSGEHSGGERLDRRAAGQRS